MAFTDFKSIRQVQEAFDIRYTESETALTINELKKVFGAIGYLMRDSLPKNPEIKHP